MNIGTLHKFQKDNRILFSTICAYKGSTLPVNVNYFIRSCIKNNIQLTLFAFDKVFENNFSTKLCHLQDCLKEIRKLYDFVINVDCLDVLLLKPLEQFFDLFPKDKVLFSAERNCYPNGSLAAKYPPCNTTYKYLNGGGFGGRMEDVLFCMDHARRYNLGCDQPAWTQAFLEDKIPVQLDSNCTVFQCLHQNENMKFTNGINEETGTSPAIIHGNGMSYINHPFYLNSICKQF